MFQADPPTLCADAPDSTTTEDRDAVLKVTCGVQAEFRIGGALRLRQLTEPQRLDERYNSVRNDQIYSGPLTSVFPGPWTDRESNPQWNSLPRKILPEAAGRIGGDCCYTGL